MLIFLVSGLLTLLTFSRFAWQNLRTKQYRAMRVSLLLCGGGALLTLAAFFLSDFWLMRGAVLLAGWIFLLMLLFFLPFGRLKHKNDTPFVRGG